VLSFRPQYVSSDASNQYRQWNGLSNHPFSSMKHGIYIHTTPFLSSTLTCHHLTSPHLHFSLLSFLSFLPLIHLYLRLLRDNPLNILHTLPQNLIQHLRVLQLLGDLRHHGVSQLLLLTRLYLALVADPGVEDSLGFGGQSGLLFELVGLGLELGGLLHSYRVSLDVLCRAASE